MPQYIGFSTILANQPRTTNAPAGNDGGVGGIIKPVLPGRKFKLVDEALVIQDLINALNIQQGQKVGQPGYGTTLWSFVFESNAPETQFRLQEEIKRVVGLDPRILLNYVKAFPQENGILIEMELAVVPFNQSKLVNLFLDNQTRLASLS